ncbi:MAG TPA: CPBP family intramembrane glutamic endopeptidase [Gammaproteobacteria bacterium]|nr:CPBP family intramembrane glutamic endopeptidase [Gammaproteobacteria bacterium]
MRPASDRKERHQDFPNVWEAVLILALLYGVEILISCAFYDAGERFSAGDPEYLGIISVLGCGFIFSILLSYKNIGYSGLFHPAKRSAVATVWLLVMPLLVLTAGSVLLGLEISEVLAAIFPMSNAEKEIFERMFSGGAISVITLCIVAPFVEEMLFRGIFLRSFLAQYSPARSIVYTSLLFGAAHLNLYQFVVATLLGLISGWLYATTRSLWPSILEHAFYNGGTVLYYMFQSDPAAGSSRSEVQVAPVWTIGGALLFIAGGLWLWKAAAHLNMDES